MRMIPRPTLLAAMVTAVTLSATTARAQSADATIERAAAAYAKVRTLQATFEQTITNPLMGTTARAVGELVQQKPNLLSVRFTDPAGDRIVADGSSIWVYLPSTNPGQVIKAALTDGTTLTPADITAQLLDAPRTRYTVADAGRATVGGRAARAVALTARGSDETIPKATLWIDDADGLVRQLEVTDGSGLVRKIVISKLAVNGAVDRTLFRFAVPTGVRVVTPR